MWSVLPAEGIPMQCLAYILVEKCNIALPKEIFLGVWYILIIYAVYSKHVDNGLCCGF